LYFPFFLRAASRRADALVFVSHSTQQDWRHYFPASDVPQFVIPLGKAPEYRPDLSSVYISKVLQRYGIRRPYLLYIGTIEPRKNLTKLVEAFASIRDSAPQYQLVIAGKKGWMYDDLFRTVSTLRLAESVVFTGFVEEQDKPFLIAGADVFVYPSLYEGFGIPVLEALSCGTPTLTSDSSSLREVAGDAAVLANPESVHDIAAKLGQLLSSQTLRASLAERGIAQASRFSWTRMATQTREVYFALGQSYEGEGNALGC
jgi:glycosyltransferase involved in cell wall biosynthesis